MLGSQIAFQAAYCGFDVTIWLRSQGSIGRTQPKIDSLLKSYTDAISLMASEQGGASWCRGIADADGSLSIEPGLKVLSWQDDTNTSYDGAHDRVGRCQYRRRVRIEPCTDHEYVDGKCKWCGQERAVSVLGNRQF